jgi:riboflavin synthase
MYTGIVADVGRIALFTSHAGGAEIAVETPLGGELSVGDSIAVDGCCLTATACDARGFRAQLSLETLARTAFRERGEGSRVNLELPVRLSDRLGGHLVQGHVDGLCTLVALRPEGDGQRLVVDVPPPLRRYVAVKGSFALDGISLTVADYDGGQAEVAVIPHTFARTNLLDRVPGQRLHIEVDVVARYIEALNRSGEA